MKNLINNLFKEGKFTSIIGAAMIGTAQALPNNPILVQVLVCVGGMLLGSKDPKIMI